MILTKNTPLEIFKDGDPISIDKEVSLDSELLEILFNKFPNSTITISTFKDGICVSKEDVLYNEEELAILVQNADMADKYKRELTFDDEYSLSQAITASRKLNDNADFINNFRVNNQPLSPIEKFMLAYSIVSNKPYLEDPENYRNSRNIISTLSGDKIVCAGFANELSALCQRIGIPCAYRINSLEGNHGIGNHATCLVNIQDEKYGVNGVFVADPTGDAKQVNSQDFPINLNFNHFLLTHEEYQSSSSNNRFDRAIKINNDPESGFVFTKIQNINLLYPTLEPPVYLNHEFFDPKTHSLDIEKIKNMLLTHIIQTFPTNLSNKSKNKPLPYFVDKSVEFHLDFILSNADKNEHTPLVSNYYKLMNLKTGSEEILKSLLDAVTNLPDQKILETYARLLEEDKRELRYTEYKKQLTRDLDKTSPISSETLSVVFKTIFSQVFPNLSSEKKLILTSKILENRANYINSKNSQPAQ